MTATSLSGLQFQLARLPTSSTSSASYLDLDVSPGDANRVALDDDRAYGVETVLRVLDHPGPRLGRVCRPATCSKASGGLPFILRTSKRPAPRRRWTTNTRTRGPSAWSRRASKGCPLTRPRSMTASHEHRTGGTPRLCAQPPWLSRRSDARRSIFQADHPAHRATRAASDLIERTAHTKEVRRKLERRRRYLFEGVIPGARNANVFLENGARLYLDTGFHPEYATPECDDVAEW